MRLNIRLGAYASLTTLFFIISALQLPESFLWGFTIMSFSPLWWPIAKFLVALFKGKPNVTLPAILTYIVALAYYFWKFGITFQSILHLILGLITFLLVVLTYDYIFTLLESEGVKSYRLKAICSYGMATALGAIYLAVLKAVLKIAL